MNKITFLIIFFLVLSIRHIAFAEAVYLKNGRVMTGRIVEKNQAFLVLQRGEGEGAVRTTIFLDDIAKMESEQDYVKSFPATPSFLSQAQMSSLLMGSGITPEALSGSCDSRERIRSLVEESRLLAAEEATRLPQEPQPVPDEEKIKMLMNPVAQKSILALTKMEKEKEDRLRAMLKEAGASAPPRVGSGRISGLITVPEAGAVRTPGGTRALYVYLMAEKTKGSFFFPVPMLYVIVTPQNVALGKASYAIKNIPPGRYKVVAEWDVDDPMIQEQAVNGKKILNYLGSRGDYMGEYSQPVDITDTSHIENLNFDCAVRMSTDISSLRMQPEAFFEIKDIYFTKPSADTSRFILVIRNTGSEPVDLLALDLSINGKKSMFPLEIGPFGPLQEKQFDITEFIDFDRKMQEGFGEVPVAPNQPLTFVFQISVPLTEEVLFEKTISVL
jgi:hypothetical protein